MRYNIPMFNREERLIEAQSESAKWLTILRQAKTKRARQEAEAEYEVWTGKAAMYANPVGWVK